MKTKRDIIYILDDSQQNLSLLQVILNAINLYEFKLFDTPTMMLEHLNTIDIETQKPSLFLLDVIMPEIDGFEVCKRLKKDERLFDVPVIFITALSSTEDIVQAFNVGAVDYILKPFNRTEIIMRVQTHIELYKNKRDLEEINLKLEEQVQQKHQQLMHSDRLATIGTLASKIVHEINNPLTVISGNSALLKRYFQKIYDKFIANNLDNATKLEKDLLTEMPKIFDTISAQAKVIGEIVNNLRIYSRASSEKDKTTEVINISENLDKIYQLVKRLNKTINIQLNLPSENIFIKLNTQHLSQILMNLIQNAAHAVANTPSPQIILSCFKENNNCVISVEDNGCGITKENLEKIWQPFFTTKSADIGTGLGLSIILELIKKNNGKIDVKSIVNQGTTFSITFPIANN